MNGVTGDYTAKGLVAREATDIGQEDAWLAKDVGTDIPRVTALHEGLGCDRVESLVVLRAGTRTLAAERMVGEQLFCERGIFDGSADLIADEVRGGVVGRLVEQDVAEVGAELQPAFLPGGFVEGMHLRPVLRGGSARGAQCAGYVRKERTLRISHHQHAFG